MRQLPYNAHPSGFLGKAIAIIATVALAGLLLMFSAVLLAVILVAGLLGWAYLWWKTRHIRKQMRGFSAQNAASREGNVFRNEVFTGEIIEGEATRVYDPAAEQDAGRTGRKQ